jgi:hypothetical protein
MREFAVRINVVDGNDQQTASSNLTQLATIPIHKKSKQQECDRIKEVAQ